MIVLKFVFTQKPQTSKIQHHSQRNFHKPRFILKCKIVESWKCAMCVCVLNGCIMNENTIFTIFCKIAIPSGCLLLGLYWVVEFVWMLRAIGVIKMFYNVRIYNTGPIYFYTETFWRNSQSFKYTMIHSHTYFNIPIPHALLSEIFNLWYVRKYQFQFVK